VVRLKTGKLSPAPPHPFLLPRRPCWATKREPPLVSPRFCPLAEQALRNWVTRLEQLSDRGEILERPLEQLRRASSELTLLSHAGNSRRSAACLRFERRQTAKFEAASGKWAALEHCPHCWPGDAGNFLFRSSHSG